MKEEIALKILLANFSKMVQNTGGVAKVQCAFANEMHRSGHEVLMMYVDEREGDFFYPVDKGIETCNLCRFQGKIFSYPRIYKIKREIYRPFSKKMARGVNDDFIKNFLLPNIKLAVENFNPDVIICFQPSAGKSFLCDLNISTPVIIMSHGEPEDYFHTYPPQEIPALEKAAACQVLLPVFAESLTRRFPNLKVAVIGNVVPQYSEQADLSRTKEFYKIIFIGRLIRNHKRPHLLIEAFSKISERYPNWIVELWGADDKPSYTESLRKKITRLNLQNRIFIKGTTQNVAQVLQGGDIFAFPSAYEGWGMTATEAMSMGLPVVAYKNCLAISELIVDGETGLLCEDGVIPFAEKISMLIENQNLRVKLGNAARNSVKKYSAENIWAAWKNLIKAVV